MTGTAAAPTRRESLAGPAVLAGAAVAGALALRVRDPHEGGWGLCPFLHLTGAYCPLCGGLRAVNDLTHLDVAAAVSSNLLVVALLPVALVLWTAWVLRIRSGAASGAVGRWVGRHGRAVALVLGAAAVVFTVARNLPAGAWLAP